VLAALEQIKAISLTGR